MLTAIILTLNEERHVTACIESLRWADKTIVFDSNSQDATVDLAHEAGAIVIQHTFENYSAQRNAALDAAEGADWVFFVDADERATPALAQEIQKITAQEGPEAGWWVARHNYIFGHRMRATGWWPDHQLRLLRCSQARYDPNRAVHEVAVLDGPAGYLENPLIHYNYETLAQFRAKQQRYTDYDAGILQEKGIRPKVYTPYTQLFRHFWWRFITLKGWRDGIYGMLLSSLMAYYEMIKYQKLARLVRT